MSCLFCRIAAGELPSASVYEDGRVFAFLDINPLAPGHTLIVPKAHAGRLQDARPGDVEAIMAAAKAILPALGHVVGAHDATMAIHNGPAAGQEVAHLHLHIIPRKVGDGGGPIHAAFRPPQRMPSDELHDIAVKVQQRLEAK